MRNSSHNPACMRAFPASQSCQVRNVDEMSAAAADWERPAASRAPRISEGDGLGIADGGYVGDKLRMCGIVRNGEIAILRKRGRVRVAVLVGDLKPETIEIPRHSVGQRNRGGSDEKGAQIGVARKFHFDIPGSGVETVHRNSSKDFNGRTAVALHLRSNVSVAEIHFHSGKLNRPFIWAGLRELHSVFEVEFHGHLLDSFGLRCATHDQGGGFLRKIGYLKSSYAELSPLMKSSSQ